jgi:hypothetical protein
VYRASRGLLRAGLVARVGVWWVVDVADLSFDLANLLYHVPRLRHQRAKSILELLNSDIVLLLLLLLLLLLWHSASDSR